MKSSRAAVTCGMSKISSVKPVSAPSASAISFTGMLMPMIETAAWIASSMMSRLRWMCRRSATPWTIVERPTAMYGATGVRSLMAGMLGGGGAAACAPGVRPRARAQHGRAHEVDAGEREPARPRRSSAPGSRPSSRARSRGRWRRRRESRRAPRPRPRRARAARVGVLRWISVVQLTITPARQQPKSSDASSALGDRRERIRRHAAGSQRERQRERANLAHASDGLAGAEAARDRARAVERAEHAEERAAAVQPVVHDGERDDLGQARPRPRRTRRRAGSRAAPAS